MNVSRRMRNGDPSNSDRSPARLQYSLRSLLILVTFSCLGLSVLTYLSIPAWVLPLLGVLAWSGLVAGQGAAALAAATSYRRRGREEDSWLAVARRRAVLLAAAASVAPAITFLLFVVVCSCAGLDVDRIEACFDRIPDSGEPGARGVVFSTWLVLLFVNPASVLLHLLSMMLYGRPARDLAFLLVRAAGLLSALVATGITLAFYASVF